LTDGANPANGPYHLQFKLYDTQSVDSGTQISSTLFFDGEQGHQPAVVATNGTFTVLLDFGANAFPGADRFLEIAVKHPAEASYTTLSQRQPVTATPYAIRSFNAASADSIPVTGVPAGSGNYIQNTTSEQTPANFNINGNGTVRGTVSASQYSLDGEPVLRAFGLGTLLVGLSAGPSNNAGTFNSFFGRGAGTKNVGFSNSFFGAFAGANSTGNWNAFFGDNTGSTTTTESGNTLLGTQARGAAGVNNSTAIGFRANVTQSNSLVLGSINGINNATSDTNVGIGTTAPAARLHIVGSQPPAVSSDNGTNATPVLQVIGGKGGDTTEGTFFSIGGLGGSVITQAGNGGSSPTAGGNGGNVIAQAGDGGSGGGFGSFGGQILLQAGAAGSGPSPGYGGSVTLQAGAGNPANGGSIFLSAGAGNSLPGAILFSTNAAERMRIAGDGSIGIGASNPSAKLEIGGNTLIYPASGNGQLFIRNRGSNNFSQVVFNDDQNTYRGYIGYIGANATNTASRNDTVEFGTNSKDLTFRPNETEVMRLTTSGKVGIGTPAPDNTLTVNGSADKPGGGSWGTFSDERLKNIKDRFTPGLKAVMQLQPLRYEYKRDNALAIKSQGEHIGFSAQAVEKIIPEAVSKNDKGYLLVNNDPIIWTMLNAIKEQQKEIETLRTANAALHGRLQAVEKSLRKRAARRR
jgi:hypothetical protein